MKTYRMGFLLALIGNVALAVVLVGLWLRYRRAKPIADVETKIASVSTQDSTAGSVPAQHRRKHRWFPCKFRRNGCRK